MTWVLILVLPALVTLIAMRDFYDGVIAIYRNDDISGALNRIGSGAKIQLDHDVILRDWSMATFLDRADGIKVDSGTNFWFVAAVYLIYPMLGMGILFSYFLVLIGFGMLMMPGAAGKYDLMLVPEIESSDPRRGFDCFAELFSHSISIMALSFCCAYLLLLQNLYLRVEATSLWAFLAPDLTSAANNFAAGRTANAIDDLIGNGFAEHVPHGGLLGLAARFAAAFMPIALLGIAYLLLRASALRGRRRILREMDQGGMSNLLKLTELPEDEVRRRLASMTSWPLSWPRLNEMLLWYGLLLTGLVFYKLGFIFMILTLIFVAYVTFNSFQTDDR